jgi:hypothetical protein
MPVDKETLKTTIREAVGEDGELYSLLEQKLLANDETATKFVGGFMRDKDYRTKTQALASDRQTMADERKTMEGQVDQYRQLLEAAETDKVKVLRDLAGHKESLSGAYARLKHIKELYQLSDQDIPDYQDLVDTKQRGKPVDTSTDIESRLADFKKELTRDIGAYLTEKLVPELGGMAQLDIVWNDIRDEHRELTGKRMTAKEAQELLNEADKRGRAGRPISLKALWEEKYDAPALRQKHHDEGLEKKLREKWDSEQAAKISEAAMAGIRPGMEQQQGLRTSQIFDHKFKVHEETEPLAVPKMRETKSAAERQALSGAERASKRFLERRGAGVPMGAPDERKPTRVA